MLIPWLTESWIPKSKTPNSSFNNPKLRLRRRVGLLKLLLVVLDFGIQDSVSHGISPIHQLLGPLISTINLVERTPTLDLSLLIGQPKLSLEHLFHVFLWLLIGYLTSFIVFFCELIWFRCHTHSKIISCEIRDRKVSRMEACRKISASKTTGEWLRIIRSSYKRKLNT